MKNFLILLVFAAAACQKQTLIHHDDPDLVQMQQLVHAQKLASVSIMDRNGLSETISAKERLKNYENSNYLTAQPYQKVLRVFAKDKNGEALSIITSYYPTGQIRQYLECSNGRAHGRYLEWHPNGQKKLKSLVLGGAADLDEKSQTTWAFNEISYCWNEDGKLIAEIPYSRGILEEASRYYYPSGKLSEIIPYKKGVIDGEVLSYDEEGAIIEATTYVAGVKNGIAKTFWSGNKPQSEEQWSDNLLKDAKYFDKEGNLVAEVTDGRGKRALFTDVLSEIQEYKSGRPEGEVLIFDEAGNITRRLFIKDGEKQGLETYYSKDNPKLAKLTIQWDKGQIHGQVKTWYPDGTPESSKEMSRNLKQGLFTAWYQDGKIMMIEEYEKDRLVRGDYIKHGATKPVSQVIDGKGVATFFDADGTFRTRVTYLDGKPVIDDLLSER